MNKEKLKAMIFVQAEGKVVTETAMRVLARREHSVNELRQKLLQRNYPEGLVKLVVELAVAAGWVDDDRFAECFVRKRIGQGYGPRRIAVELVAKGIAGDQAKDIMLAMSPDWVQEADNALRKKYKETPVGGTELQKQQRYLLRRGFCWDVVKEAFSST